MRSRPISPLASWTPFYIGMTILAGALLVCTVALDLGALPHETGLGSDFSAFYAAGLTVRAGHNPYNWTQLGQTEAHVGTVVDPQLPMIFNSYANPPLFAKVMAAYTIIPQPVAYAWWLAAMAAMLVGSLVIIAGLYSMRGPRSVAFLLLFAVTPIPIVCYYFGQQTPILLLALAGSLALLRRSRPGWAGIIVSVAWIKPHLLFPVIVVLIGILGWSAARRFIAGLIGSSVVLGLLSWWTTGSYLLWAWVQTLLVYAHRMDNGQPLLSSLAGVYLSVVKRPWSIVLNDVCMIGWIGLMAVVLWRARRTGVTVNNDGGLRVIAIALVSWLLLTPYVHPADLVLLGMALPAVLGPQLEGLSAPLVRLTIGALLTAPTLDLLGFSPNYLFTYSVSVPLFLLAALLTHKPRSRDDDKRDRGVAALERAYSCSTATFST